MNGKNDKFCYEYHTTFFDKHSNSMTFYYHIIFLKHIGRDFQPQYSISEMHGWWGIGWQVGP